jgi:hypothetical protein
MNLSLREAHVILGAIAVARREGYELVDGRAFESCQHVVEVEEALIAQLYSWYPELRAYYEKL